MLIAFLIMGTASMTYGNGPSGDRKKSTKRIYEIVSLTDNRVKLITQIHLVPPGSRLLHENVEFKDIGTLPVKENLEKKARVDIDFFEKKLREEMGKDKDLKFETALFNIYLDFMGKYTTDLIYMIYKIQGTTQVDRLKVEGF